TQTASDPLPARVGCRVPVVISLGTALAALPDEARALLMTLGPRIMTELEAVFEQLGIPGRPRIDFRRTGSARTLSVAVNGRPLAYPLSLERRLWASSLPREAEVLRPAQVPEAQPGDHRFDPDLPTEQRHWDRVVSFLCRLVVEIAQQSPDGFFLGEQADAFLERKPTAKVGSGPEVPAAPTPERLVGM